MHSGDQRTVPAADVVYKNQRLDAYLAGLSTGGGGTTGALLIVNNLSDVNNVATSRTNLGLGTAATKNTATSGANVPLLSTANTWTLTQTMPALFVQALGSPQLLFNDQSQSPTAGGRVRLLGNGGDYAYQINTAAAGDYSSLVTAYTVHANGTFEANAVTVGSALTVNGSLTLTNNALILDGPVNSTNRAVSYRTNNVTRFYHGLTTTPESGTNTGADFFIARTNNSGTYIDQPLTIERATGNITLSQNLIVVGDETVNNLTAAANIAGSALYSTGNYVSIDGPINTNKVLYYKTNGSVRWVAFGSSSAETGGNVGSDYTVSAYADNGTTFLGNALVIQRSDLFARVNTPAPGDNSTKIATTAFVQNAAGGGGSEATGSTFVAGPIVTASTTSVFVGMNKSITPTKTGRVLVTATGDIFSAVGAATMSMQLYISAVPNQAPPASLAATTGNLLSGATRAKSNAAGIWYPWALTGVITGLTLNSSYWVDIGFLTGTSANSANIQDISLTLVEL